MNLTIAPFTEPPSISSSKEDPLNQSNSESCPQSISEICAYLKENKAHISFPSTNYTKAMKFPSTWVALENRDHDSVCETWQCFQCQKVEETLSG